MQEEAVAEPNKFLEVLPRHLVSAVFCAALRQHELALKLADRDDQDAAQLRRCDPRKTLPLVCKAFLEASNEAVGLWQRVQLNLLTLTAERVPCLARWLLTHAPAIRILVLYGRPLSTVEAALQEHADALAAAIQRAALLQQLDLGRPLGTLVLARLQPQQLPCLRSVGVDLANTSSSRSGGAGGGYAGRRQLASGASEVQQAIVRLMQLPALSELFIRSWFEAQLLVRDPCLHPLEHLHFADVGDLHRSPMLGPLACLRSLTCLRFSQRDGFRLPGPLTALARLARLHAAARYPFDPVHVGPDVTALSGLRALWLQHASFEAPAALAGLRQLHTLALVGGANEYAAVLQSLEGATPLRALHLEAHAMAVSEVPAEAWQALSELAGGGLTRLELPHCRLRELPPGAYLGGLQVLDLSYNSLAGVPPALVCSGSLQCLNVSQQEAAAPGASGEDVLVLQQLPRLRLLVTSAGRYGPSYISTGLRSAAEVAHLQYLRSALPAAVRVTNQHAEFDRAVGRLGSLFEVSLRQDKL